MASKLTGLIDEFINRFVFLFLSMGSLERFIILINNNEVIV